MESRPQIPRPRPEGSRLKAKAKDLAPEAKAKDTPAGLEAPRGQGRGLEDSISDSILSLNVYRVKMLLWVQFITPLSHCYVNEIIYVDEAVLKKLMSLKKRLMY